MAHRATCATFHVAPYGDSLCVPALARKELCLISLSKNSGDSRHKLCDISHSQLAHSAITFINLALRDDLRINEIVPSVIR